MILMIPYTFRGVEKLSLPVYKGEMADDRKDCPAGSKDLLELGPAVGERERLFVRHLPTHQMQAGVLCTLREGEPLAEGGTLVHLTRRGEGSTYEVQELYSRSEGTRTGPAMVTSDAYRDNWEGIFGKRPVPQA
jgi:hypothetical protein